MLGAGLEQRVGGRLGDEPLHDRALGSAAQEDGEGDRGVGVGVDRGADGVEAGLVGHDHVGEVVAL